MEPKKKILFFRKEQLVTPDPNNLAKLPAFGGFPKYFSLFLSCCALVLFSTVQAQAQNYTQLGADIYGEAAEDFSGNSVSISADGKTWPSGLRGMTETGLVPAMCGCTNTIPLPKSGLSSEQT